MNPSERIRAALQRSEGTRHPDHEPATLESAEPETTLPLLAASDEKRTQPRSEAAAAEPAIETFEQDPLRSAAARYSKTHRRLHWMYLGIAGAVALALLGAFLFWGRRSGPSKDTADAGSPDRPLQLETISEGSGLIKIHWNSRSSAVVHAREGKLFIMERGQQPRLVALDPDQLKIGHLAYQSAADGVEFRLEVRDPAGTTTQETTAGPSSGLKEPAVAAAAPNQIPAPEVEKPKPVEKSLAAPLAAGKPNQAPPAAAVETPQPARPEARAFVPPPVNRKSAPQEESVLLDPSVTVPAGSVIRPGAVLPEMPKVAPPPEVKAAAPQRPMPVGGKVQSANLVRKVAPVYPPLARTAHVQGTVRFTAVIAKDGTVRDLKLLSGQQMLVKAAADAVKQWVYRPTLLNGNAIEVTTQIDVDFTLK